MAQPTSAGTVPVGMRVFQPRAGYDLAASYYDSWKWQKIWRELEWPHVDSFFTEIGMMSGGVSSILDVGTGTGNYLQHAIDQFHISNCCGLDVSDKMLDIAERKLKSRAELALGDVRDLPYSDGAFDTVVMCRVASHIPQIALAATEIRRVLRCGGFLIVSDIDPRHPYQCTRIPYGSNKISIATFKHTVEEWACMLVALGFRIHLRQVIWSDLLDRVSGIDLPTSLASRPPHPVSFVLGAQKYVC